MRDAVATSLEAEFAVRSATLRAEYEAKLTEMRSSYPAQMARRLATSLMHTAGGSAAVAEFLAGLPAAMPTMDPLATTAPTAPPTPAPAVAVTPSAPARVAAPEAPVVAAPVSADDDDALVIEPWIDSARCTTCNECTNINKKMFAYNADKQATIKDPTAGTFQQLVTAAERCPVGIIHPGTPLNPNEKDLAKWTLRAAKFN